jgi:HIV Tat-specific factor 1
VKVKLETLVLLAGVVDRVCIFQYNPEGVATVKFKTEEAAHECVRIMHGRFFGGRKVEAALWDGFTDYYVKKPQETAEEQEARLERFAMEIEKENA